MLKKIEWVENVLAAFVVTVVAVLVQLAHNVPVRIGTEFQGFCIVLVVLILVDVYKARK